MGQVEASLLVDPSMDPNGFLFTRLSIGPKTARQQGFIDSLMTRWPTQIWGEFELWEENNRSYQ